MDRVRGCRGAAAGRLDRAPHGDARRARADDARRSRRAWRGSGNAAWAANRIGPTARVRPRPQRRVRGAPRPRRSPPRQLELVEPLPRQLHEQRVTVRGDELDPRVESVAGDPLDLRLDSAGNGIRAHVQIVRSHPAVAEPVCLAHELHHELCRRLVVELRWIPTCSIRPSFITAIWLATSIASAWSCVTKMVVTHLLVKLPQPSRNSARTRASSAPNGSSRSRAQVGERGRGRGLFADADRRTARRGAVTERLELDELQQLVDPVPDLGLRALANLQAEGDVVPTVMCLNAA